MKGKTNRGLSPWQKFQFCRNYRISWIKIREGEISLECLQKFVFHWHLASRCLLRAMVPQDQGCVRKRSGGA